MIADRTKFSALRLKLVEARIKVMFDREPFADHAEAIRLMQERVWLLDEQDKASAAAWEHCRTAKATVS